MNRTVSSLKVGERLVLGRYGVKNDIQYPIQWLKATPNCDFIAEHALDYMMFDARENNDQDYYRRAVGNPDFSVSNIFCFINSDQEAWYRPMHDTDEPQPTHRYPGARGDHMGFLIGFDEYEIESMVVTQYSIGAEEVQSKVRLPSISEVIGDRRFELFKRRGIRAKATSDLIDGNLNGFGRGSYIDFWTMNVSPTSQYRVAIYSRNGTIESKAPSELSGLRPVCSIRPDLPVSIQNDGSFRIIPFEVQVVSTCTDDELYALLGLAHH